MTREADNPMTRCDFDWMVSNHAVWGWKALVKASCQVFLSFSSLPFLLPSFPFSPETPDTQAMRIQFPLQFNAFNVRLVVTGSCVTLFKGQIPYGELIISFERSKIPFGELKISFKRSKIPFGERIVSFSRGAKTEK